MYKKALVGLFLAILFVATFAVNVKPVHAVTVAWPVHFTLEPWPWDSLYDAINFGPPFLKSGDHIHILAGHVETLPASFVIPATLNNIWIFGDPGGATPSINLNGFTITIAASNVFMYGLDFWDPIPVPGVPGIDLAPPASGCTIRDCSISGNLVVGSIGIQTSNSANNLIANNMIRDWGTGIYIWGPGSTGNKIKLNNIDYTLMPPMSAYGIQVGGGAGLGTPNWICWNNIFAYPCPPFSGLGQEIVDLTLGNPPNVFDDTGPPPLTPNSFFKGNYESSWAWPPPYPVVGNGRFDNYPLLAPMSPLSGDINLDGRVDIYDAILLAKAFGSVWCSPYWDTRADLKPDSAIDIYDAIRLASRFGTSY